MRVPRQLFPFAVLSTFSVLAAGCDSPSGPAPAGAPAGVQVVAGDAQQDIVGRELPVPLVVRVSDAGGKPVPGQAVDFRVVSGGGSVAAGSAVTDSDGQARARWTVGTVAADSQRVEARAAGAAAEAVAAFRAVAVPDGPAALQVVGSPAFAGGVAAALADSLAARVVDRFGNPIPGAQVAWEVSAGGGSVSPVSATADGAGVARAQWTLGPVLNAPQEAAARLGGVPPAAFTASAALAPETPIEVARIGDGQTGTVAAALPQPVGVRVTLADGRPLVGVKVRWGSVVVRTGAEGVATLPITLPTKSGPVEHTVLVGEQGERSAVFHFTARPGPAARFNFGNDVTYWNDEELFARPGGKRSRSTPTLGTSTATRSRASPSPGRW